MAKKVGQIRYYGESASKSTKNYPQMSGLALALQSGTYFTSSPHRNIQILQFGIQTMPGVQFFINGTQTPVIVGSTGIYELDVDGLASITTLSFSAISMEMISASDLGYLIIDYVYEEED